MSTHLDANSRPRRAKPLPQAPEQPPLDHNAVLCRSGAAARMAGIPVATLRVWERRYGVVGPARTASGQRLYAPQDVERLVLLKQLVDLGHAIGTIAASPLSSLRALAAARVGAAGSASRPVAKGRATLVVLVGGQLLQRMQTMAGRRTSAWVNATWLATFDDVAQALAAPTTTAGSSAQADVLLVHAATLQPDSADELLLLAQQWPLARVIVLYGFAPEPVVERLRDLGVDMHREPLSCAEIGSLLVGSTDTHRASPSRRFDDAALAHFASLSTNVACECPRHVAEIVMQLSAFETYSGQCASRSPADARLHAYLADVAGSARAMFEAALERVARVEGLAIPVPPEPIAAASG